MNAVQAVAFTWSYRNGQGAVCRRESYFDGTKGDRRFPLTACFSPVAEISFRILLFPLDVAWYYTDSQTRQSIGTATRSIRFT